MNTNSAPLGQVMAERFDFTPYQCVLDVAGGLGGMVISIGQRYPHLRGIVMDMGAVCEIAAEYIQAGGLADRVTTAVADLFAGLTRRAQMSSRWGTSCMTGAMKSAASFFATVTRRCPGRACCW